MFHLSEAKLTSVHYAKRYPAPRNDLRRNIFVNAIMKHSLSTKIRVISAYLPTNFQLRTQAEFASKLKERVKKNVDE